MIIVIIYNNINTNIFIFKYIKLINTYIYGVDCKTNIYIYMYRNIG